MARKVLAFEVECSDDRIAIRFNYKAFREETLLDWYIGSSERIHMDHGIACTQEAFALDTWPRKLFNQSVVCEISFNEQPSLYHSIRGWPKKVKLG